MKQISVLVIDPVGLHARPATVAVNAASKFKSEVKVAYKGRSVNMKPSWVLCPWAFRHSPEVTVTCEGEDEEVAITTIEEVLRAQKDNCISWIE